MPHADVARGPLALAVVVPAVAEGPPGGGALRHGTAAVGAGAGLDDVVLIHCVISLGPHRRMSSPPHRRVFPLHSSILGCLTGGASRHGTADSDPKTKRNQRRPPIWFCSFVVCGWEGPCRGLRPPWAHGGLSRRIPTGVPDLPHPAHPSRPPAAFAGGEHAVQRQIGPTVDGDPVGTRDAELGDAGAGCDWHMPCRQGSGSSGRSHSGFHDGPWPLRGRA